MKEGLAACLARSRAVAFAIFRSGMCLPAIAPDTVVVLSSRRLHQFT